MNLNVPVPGTRERVLDAAERLFAGRGFAGTSVREITDAAGANLGAVNYYFRSKERLYAEVFTRRAALFSEPVLAAAREAAGAARMSPEEAFRALGRAFLAPYEDRHASLRLLELFAREVVEPCLPRHLFVRLFVVPTIGAITSIVRQARPDLAEATARACAHAFFAQLVHVAKGIGIAVTTVDERLEQAVCFTVAAVMHLDAVPHGRPRRKAHRRSS
jgi:TetR/AcrR family transcriptional regulator, regulator of cefoperazone and chloramphenicol sensitivity